MSVQARCPGCGADIAFKRDGSLCVVCSYCNAVVGRGDRTIEQLGKVGDLVETQSPLELGLKGQVGDQHFELVGRAQMHHPAGGVWDEWYASFSDGRWGWLAEAQGHFYLLFQQPLPAPAPDLNSLAPGAQAYLDLVVAERATATTGSARGELPWRLVPNEPFAYADLSGPGGTFATLDYSWDPPAFFAGREVTLDEIGLGQAKLREPAEARRVKGAEVRCPQCGGPLELRAPDQSLRVTCPSCSALLDCSQGKLAYLQSLNPPPVAPAIAIGSTGDLAGHRWQVLGFLQRSVTADGERYPWDEYLLYEAHTGFRWLVCSNDHWNFVEPVPAGDVQEHYRNATFRKQSFRKFNFGQARVDYVMGEFYWQINEGEEVSAADYIAPPLMLSTETSANEVNCSLGTYTPVADVERAFGVTLARPSTVGANQPYPHKGVLRSWKWLLLATWIGGCAMISTRHQKTIYENNFELEPPAAPAQTQTFFSEPFTLDGHKNIRIKFWSEVNNTWAYVEGDLIEENTGLVQTFAVPIEYYSGYDSDGSWSEGDMHPDIYLSSLPAGQYTLRLEVQWEKQTTNLPLRVRIDQGVSRYSHLALVLLGISIIPILIFFGRIRFEARRWAQSDFT
jgi:hypothetical protein